MAFIVRIALLCLLLAALPCIAVASEGGEHDHGYDTGGVSPSVQDERDSPAESDGGRESEGSGTGSTSAGPASGGQDTSGSDSSGNRDAGTGTPSPGSDAAIADSMDDRSTTPEETSGSGTEDRETRGHSSGGIAASGTGSDGKTPEPDNARDSLEPADTGAGTGITGDTGHESTGITDGADSRGSLLTRADSGSAGSEEPDEYFSREDANNKETSSRDSLKRPYENSDHKDGNDDPDALQGSIRDPDEPDAGPDHDKGHDLRESRDLAPEEEDLKDGTGAPAEHGDDGESPEKPETGGISSGDSRTLFNDPMIFSGNPGNHESRTLPENPEYRSPAPDSRGPDSPRPEQDPRSKRPFDGIPALPASGLPLCAAAVIPDGARPQVRSKGKDEYEPFWHPTDSALVLSPWMLLKLWCFLGFRRVLRKNVLESDERRTLYESIMQNPGVDLSRLTEMLRLNKETARYHLKMLAANGKISGLIKQGIARYFPCRETISEFEKTVIHYLWIATTKRILLLLIESPGLTRQAIARELGIAGPSVTWQMQRLADDGLIVVRNEGRFVRYFLTPDSVEVLGNVTNNDGRQGTASG